VLLTGLFVTGTDTGVGKTFVTAAIARGLTERGLRVRASKPVESGGGDDAARIAAAAGHAPLCAYRFAAPIAPGIAAELDGGTLDFDRMVGVARSGEADLALIEGAGGLLCPMGGTRTMADFALATGYPLLVVARASLGTINHTLLTLSEARRCHLSIFGVILNRIQPERGPDEDTNAELIARLGGAPVLGVVEHGDVPLPPPLLNTFVDYSRPRSR
jgi:dethiobiotin synthetase